MNSIRWFLSLSLALALVWAPVFPPPANAQSAPSAGQVALVIPAVNLQRGAQQLAATPHAPVFWGDVVNTARLARARVALNDGSILNVGSASSLQIVSHDAAAQQTQIDLLYGRVRARAVHLTKPGASYQIHTRLGTAGVVGTDLFLALEGDILRLIVFEGIVRFCNLAGVCVNVGAGKMSIIRGNLSPSAPVAVSNALLSDAVNSTTVGPIRNAEGLPIAHHSPWLFVGLLAAAAIPAIVVAATNGSSGTIVRSSSPLVIQCPSAVAARCTH
jgi:hypothetical protein